MIDIYEDDRYVYSVSDTLAHVGRGHLDGGHSGRYPWGSGESPFQRYEDFLSRIRELREKNFSMKDKVTGKIVTGDTAIAKSMKLSTTEFRRQMAIAEDQERNDKYIQAKALFDSGHGYTEIARRLHLKNESSARSLLDAEAKHNMEKSRKTAEFLKKMVDERGMIDIGPGIENKLGISRNKLMEAVYILKMEEGYENPIGRLKNVTDPSGARQTTLQFLGAPGTKAKDIYDLNNLHFMSEEDYNKFREEMGIATISDYKTRDNGETYVKGFRYPESMDSSRLAIRYAEDGGVNKDGMIEIRRGVADLDLGDSTYAQVRILVDDTHYLKGMALYSDDMPKGVDVVFNTNKTRQDAPNKLDALKDTSKNLAKDPDNPFGSSIKEEGGQYEYIGKDGKKHLGLINKTREEGDWSQWKDKVPSQFLSKQPIKLAERQIALAIKDKEQEFNDIMALENNTLKKNQLLTFASDCDSSAVHLYAAALPRQKHQVILSIDGLKETEVYAPNYENGEKVALIRYPHAGTFEIPILTVNNKNEAALKVLSKNTADCVGINHKVAEQLSGADFDGDTVMVIPTGKNGVDVKATSRLKGLYNSDGSAFDPKTAYATKEVIENGVSYRVNKNGNKCKIMTDTDNQMGRISNLITDMTIAGANEDELARAVRHSMVVIDAEKHKLDYTSSAKENRIDELKQTYQKNVTEDGRDKYGGASTLISRAKSETAVLKTQGSRFRNPNLKYNADGSINKNYDPSKPEGAEVYKTADPNKLNYVSIKDTVTKKNQTVYVEDKKTGKYHNLYYKNDGKYYYQKGRGEEVKVTNEDFVYNKGGKTHIDKKTGKEVKDYVKVTDEKLINNFRTQKSTQMADHADARDLISKYNSPMEKLYANYANKLKALANQARKEEYLTPNSKYDPVAKKTYAKEVESLNNKIDISTKNAPMERQAQVLATTRVRAKVGSNPGKLKKDDLKKINQQELTKAREEVGASRKEIEITDSEWEAIQAGAIASSKQQLIFKYADTDKLRERATPKAKKEVTTSMIARINSMKNNGKTNAEIAAALGISASTVSKYIE